jgi:nitrite reductase/ring-hydroxylating ferredoxin subunit
MLPGAPGEWAYGLEGRVLRCPWHGWEFDVEGGKMLFGTGNRRLTVFPVTVRDGRVFVEVPRPRRHDR